MVLTLALRTAHSLVPSVVIVVVMVLRLVLLQLTMS